MRALPMIERVLLVIMLVMIVLLLVFLLVWHLRWRQLVAELADPGPRQGEIAVAPLSTTTIEDPAWRAWARRQSHRDWLAAYAADDHLDDLIHHRSRLYDPSILSDLHTILLRGQALGHPTGSWFTSEPPDRVSGNIFDDIPRDCQESAHTLIARAGEPALATDALADLDALFAATPPDAADALYNLRIDLAQSRDAAWLLATLAGAARPAASCARWRDQTWDPLPVYLDAQQRWRRWTIPQETATAFARGPWAVLRDQWPTSARERLERWWNLPRLLPAGQLECALIEDAILARRADPIDHSITRMMDPDVFLVEALHTLTCHRLAVLAISALAQRHEAGNLPDQLDLDLAAHDDLPPLNCTHDAHHLHISVDPAAPMLRYLSIAFADRQFPPKTNPPLSLSPYAVTIDLDDPMVRTLMAGTWTARSP